MVAVTAMSSQACAHVCATVGKRFIKRLIYEFLETMQRRIKNETASLKGDLAP